MKVRKAFVAVSSCTLYDKNISGYDGKPLSRHPMMACSRGNDDKLSETVGVHRIGYLWFPADYHQRIAGGQTDILVIEVEFGEFPAPSGLIDRFDGIGSGLWGKRTGGHDKIVLVYAQGVKAHRAWDL